MGGWGAPLNGPSRGTLVARALKGHCGAPCLQTRAARSSTPASPSPPSPASRYTACVSLWHRGWGGGMPPAQATEDCPRNGMHRTEPLGPLLFIAQFHLLDGSHRSDTRRSARRSAYSALLCALHRPPSVSSLPIFPAPRPLAGGALLQPRLQLGLGSAVGGRVSVPVCSQARMDPPPPNRQGWDWAGQKNAHAFVCNF